MADKYEIHAQYVPAILYSASFALIGFYFLAQIPTDIWGTILKFGVGGTTMTFALYQLAKHSGRFLGVRLQELVFQDGRDLPTTRFLLDGDTVYTADRKAEIIAKIKSDFGTDLSGRTADTTNNRQRIHEIVGQVRKKFIKREMVLQRNIQYGFWRNLAGGSAIAIAVSITAVILSILTHMNVALTISLVFLGAYILTAIVSFFAMKLCAKYYALALYDELLGEDS